MVSARIQKQWTAAFHDHYPCVVGYLKSKFNLDDASEDVAQEAFAKTFTRIDIDQVDNLRAYLMSAARNQAINYIKKEDRLDSFVGEPEVVAHFELRARASIEADPVLFAETRSLAKSIDKTLSDLSDKCSSAFVLHRVLGLTHKECAEKLGVSTSAIEKYVMRASERCATQLVGAC